jgi:hypothetical protein
VKALIAVVVALTMLAPALALAKNGGNGHGGSGNGGSSSGGGGNGGGGNGGNGGGNGGGAGAGNTGGSAGNGNGGSGGNGDSGGSGSAVGGSVGDAGSGAPSSYEGSGSSGSLRGARKGTALLTPNQEYTWDVFHACRASKDVVLTGLKPNGGFTFSAEFGLDAADTIKCMSRYGFSFPNTPIGRPIPVPAGDQVIPAQAD